MSGTPQIRTRPLVALVCGAPVVAEALTATLEGICEVMPLHGAVSDLPGLIHAIRPDGVVFDSSLDAAGAAQLMGTSGPVLVHVSANDAAVLVLGHTGWQRRANEASPDEVRNVLAGALFQREAGT